MDRKEAIACFWQQSLWPKKSHAQWKNLWGLSSTIDNSRFIAQLLYSNSSTVNDGKPLSFVSYIHSYTKLYSACPGNWQPFSNILESAPNKINFILDQWYFIPDSPIPILNTEKTACCCTFRDDAILTFSNRAKLSQIKPNWAKLRGPSLKLH